MVTQQEEDAFSKLNSMPNVMENKKTLLFLQDSTTLIFGLCSGILQLESMNGFYMFVLSYVFVCSLFLMWICHGKPAKYFMSPIQDIFLESFFRELMGFVMAWTFSYALVG
ncbi:Emc6p NDAI_0D01890 [Naumovozyma dairenensis CBS 421]|uniref:ER membrane protein complex subunit 6 n=1 Tax=Naumovozyma dairenensis (strain ATCC 10597 / BCRC 20456 / CBS 421 / NBRC 0211 / NRRL Y-12639) TaxID=1071378 RepID=G0W9P2_NAUDC|nr:hypothetical protein NDAI_0D01890 [Naumovozyma dairenensis CBS 421]CCD24503.1 hypothetical protein NDAI_0D01890 [Naumovozyma dairenensis CBS 421]